MPFFRRKEKQKSTDARACETPAAPSYAGKELKDMTSAERQQRSIDNIGRHIENLSEMLADIKRERAEQKIKDAIEREKFNRGTERLNRLRVKAQASLDRLSSRS